MGSITIQKKKLATELRQLIAKVKDFDYENRELQQKIKTSQNCYDEKMEDMGGQKIVTHIKLGLK